MKVKRTLRTVSAFVLRVVVLFLANTATLNAQPSAIDSVKSMLNLFENKITDPAIKKLAVEAQSLIVADTLGDSLATKLFALEENLFRTEEVSRQTILQFFLLIKSTVDQSRNKKWQNTMSAINNLAFVYGSMGNYEKAIQLNQQALSVIRDAAGEENEDYYSCLNNLAWLYERIALFEKSDSSYQIVLQLIKKIKGQEHADYATGLSNLAGLYKDRGWNEKAISLYQESSRIHKRVGGEQTQAYAAVLNNLGIVYVAMGLYEKALPVYNQSVAILKTLFGEKNTDLTSALHNMAQLYESLGLYDKALSLYYQVITIDKEALGENNPDYALSLNDLGYLYESMGQYQKALPLYQQALVVIAESLGKDTPEYAAILDNVAELYHGMSQYDKAQHLYTQSMAIRKRILGENHLDYAKSLNNLAGLYKDMGLKEKAITLFQQASAIIKSLGEMHPAYATTLNSLASTYTSMGKYSKALPLYDQALTIRKKILGEEHPDYARSLSGKAVFYEKTGQYQKALSLYEAALKIRKNTLGENHPDYADNLNKLGLIHIRLKEHQIGLTLISQAAKLQLNNLSNLISSLSEQEKLTSLISATQGFDLLPSVLFTKRINGAKYGRQLYNNELVLKGMVLQDQQNILNTIRKSGDSSALQSYEQWRFLKKVLGKQLSLPRRNRVLYLDSLEDVVTKLEQTLSRKSAAFNNVKKNESTSDQDVKQTLSPGEAAIEFTRFRLYDKTWKDSVMYAALLILPDDTLVKFIPLFEESQLQRLLISRGYELVDASIAKLYRGTSPTRISSNNDSLYLLIWKPLERYLGAINTIYYAPTGLLHRIAFQALKAGSNNLLINKYRLNQVLSTRSIVSNKNIYFKPTTAHIWGDIQYDNQKNQSEIVNDSRRETLHNDTLPSASNYYESIAKLSAFGDWKPLAGAKEEVKMLQTLFEQANIKVVIDSGMIATEENFKAMDGQSPQLIHVATHGFFVREDNKINNARSLQKADGNQVVVQENTMLRTGLVLAGSNKVRKGNATTTGKEDGILTAYEIAQMDLSHTDLVVLSACETALGDLVASEGVFGLQRAYKIAGVKQIILSLWKIPDVETKELMTAFYTNWLESGSAREALRMAQLKMEEKYPSYYWAGFVLIE